MNMNKKVLAVLAVFALLIGASACVDTPPQQQQQQQQDD